MWGEGASTVIHHNSNQISIGCQIHCVPTGLAPDKENRLGGRSLRAGSRHAAARRCDCRNSAITAIRSQRSEIRTIAGPSGGKPPDGGAAQHPQKIRESGQPCAARQKNLPAARGGRKTEVRRKRGPVLVLPYKLNPARVVIRIRASY